MKAPKCSEGNHHYDKPMTLRQVKILDGIETLYFQCSCCGQIQKQEEAGIK